MAPAKLFALVAWAWAALSSTFPAVDPPASDLFRFPGPAECEAKAEFFAGRRAWLMGQQELYFDKMYAPWFRCAFADLDAREGAWEALRYAHCWRQSGPYESEYTPPRRAAYCRSWLARLRDRLGPDAYATGAMPAVIDVRLCVPIDP